MIRAGVPGAGAQLCAAATGKPLTDDERQLIAACPHQLALLYPAAAELT